MTTLREAAQQALEALGLAKLNGKAGLYPAEVEEITDAITALRTALAEPVQEPAYKVKITGRWHDAEPFAAAFSLPDGEHLLYTAPPQRKPLTEEEIDSIWDSEKAFADIYAIARAIERAHGIV